MNTENKKKVLIVDDNQSLNDILIDKLNLSGFDASGVLDGEEGLKKALELHPDVILLDLVMPKMDGLTMLEKLREDSWGNKCKVIVLTLVGEQYHIAKAVEFGVLGYIVKTDNSLEDIVKQISTMIANS
jgi:DNA-binding response OmpR family regulator